MTKDGFFDNIVLTEGGKVTKGVNNNSRKKSFSRSLGDLSVLNQQYIKDGRKNKHLLKLKNHISGPITLKLNKEQAELLASIVGDLVLKVFLDDYNTTTQEERITITNLEHNIILGIQRAEKRSKK